MWELIARVVLCMLGVLVVLWLHKLRCLQAVLAQ